jgi:hypothetical protein
MDIRQGGLENRRRPLDRGVNHPTRDTTILPAARQAELISLLAAMPMAALDLRSS